MDTKAAVSVQAGTLPWTRSCFVCGETNPHGFHLRSRVEGDKVVLAYTTRQEDVGYQNVVHGGIIGTLLDEVMTWAAILHVGRPCVAAEFTTRLKKPVTVGQTLRIEGTVSIGRPRLVVAEGVVRDGQGHEVATGSGKYLPMNPEQYKQIAKDFVISPDSIHPRRIFLAPPA